ncbi:MAG: isoaspartyl peptidase/L-asparaginase family protein [Bacteroidota bacterium]
MKYIIAKSVFLSLFAFLILSCKSNYTQEEKLGENQKEWALVIHGGAGVITRKLMTSERDSAYRKVLTRALETGEKVLSEGGSAIDAVEKTIHVMEKSVHVMLAGEGASDFAVEQGLEQVDPSYFYTDHRYRQLTEAINREKNGTVGCCALDKDGNLAAGTSTGGMTNKKYNRIGDAPVIGAGTYANNSSCAVSATGHGEYFIRWTVAHDISALMEYGEMSLYEAANLVINDKLVKAGGTGGVVSLDKYGNIAMPFNTEGMFRGFVDSDGDRAVHIYKDE